MVERVWEWHFAASPEELWPVLADTARFNEAIGLPRYTIEETPQPDGSVRRTASVHRFGLTLRWEEGVPEWVAPRRFAHERRFNSGPLRRAATEITIDPDSRPGEAAGSRVRYRVRLDPRSWPVGLLLRAGMLGRFGRVLDRLFREAADFALAGRDEGLWSAPAALSAAARTRLAARTQALVEQGYPEARRLAAHLSEAPVADIERMRPRALARQWRVAPRAIIETCLAAARAGMLVLRWDLICPRCHGAKSVVASLDQLPQGAHCPSCNLPFDRDFSRNVEVTFDPAPDIRPIAGGTYCLASPLATRHIKLQRRIAAGSMATIEAELADGDYRVRTIEAVGASDFHVADGVLPDIVLTEGDPVLRRRTDRGRLHARNADAFDRTLVIEDRRWASDALTAHEVTTLQAFRDLFADAVLRPGDRVEIRRIALMFTDIRGSSDLYNRVGDAQAYGWVREHFAVLAGAIRRHDGAVVKTIGDAVMAAFSNPADALAAALTIRDDIAAFNRELTAESNGGEALIVKIGLHCGPCIAVTLNDHLDYFGRTVNLAARLQNESRGGDIVLSAAMADEPGMAAALEPLRPGEEAALVKGFAEPIPLLRIAPCG